MMDQKPVALAAHGASIFKTSDFLGILLLASSLILQALFPAPPSSISAGICNSFGTVLILVGITILR